MHKYVFIVITYLLAHAWPAGAQEKAVADTSFKPSGKLWGYTFGDYYYKAHSDPLNRGGANQYTGIEKGRNAFQIRRVYLGYNYEISPKFAAEVLLAAEDNITTSTGATSGDLLGDNKLSFYIKLANHQVEKYLERNRPGDWPGGNTCLSIAYGTNMGLSFC